MSTIKLSKKFIFHLHMEVEPTCYYDGVGLWGGDGATLYARVTNGAEWARLRCWAEQVRDRARRIAVRENPTLEWWEQADRAYWELCFTMGGRARSDNETPFGRWQSDLIVYPVEGDRVDDRDMRIGGGMALSWRAPHQFENPYHKVGMVFEPRVEYGERRQVFLFLSPEAEKYVKKAVIASYALENARGNY